MSIVKHTSSKSKLPLFLWGGFLLLCSLVSCMKEEDYSTSPSDLLRFSKDTLDFGVVISGQPTQTYTFMVYNPHDKSIRIPSVYLQGGTTSDFRVNVDGAYLENGNGTDFEIASHDSMRVFLFLNTPESDADQPIPTEDKLVFITQGGAQQEVVLKGSGQSVIPLKGAIITRDTLLDAKRPYQIFDSLVVAEQANLKLAAGVRLYFHPNASLLVDGKIEAAGSIEQPVTFRGDRLGDMFSQQPYDRIPGQWGGIILRGSSYGNHLSYCDIHSGTFGIRCDSSDISMEKLRIENSIIHNVSGNGLAVRGANIFAGNCQITNAGGDCVQLIGGNSTFIHCTIGRFYVFQGGEGVALRFTNEDNETHFPLQKADFHNCIITGYAADEIMGTPSDKYDEETFNYLFNKCLLNTPEIENGHANGCLWETDADPYAREKNFTPEFDLKQLLFNFELAPTSRAVNSADAQIAKDYYPTDRLGRSRLSDDGPDLGCYEMYPSAETKRTR